MDGRRCGSDLVKELEYGLEVKFGMESSNKLGAITQKALDSLLGPRLGEQICFIPEFRFGTGIITRLGSRIVDDLLLMNVKSN